MSLVVHRLQVRVGEPQDGPPTAYGYWVACGHEHYSTWPFPSAEQRAHYEAAVSRYLDLEGLVRPSGTALHVAALVVLGGEGEAQDEFSLEHLAPWGLTGRPLADLRLLADHTIISAVV